MDAACRRRRIHDRPIALEIATAQEKVTELYARLDGGWLTRRPLRCASRQQ
jgi:hypothetical protein